MPGRVLMVMGFSLWAACGGTSSNDAITKDGQPLEIVLHEVTVRQYRHGDLRLELFAPRLVLDEQDGEIRAHDGVRAVLRPRLWGCEPR